MIRGDSEPRPVQGVGLRAATVTDLELGPRLRLAGNLSQAARLPLSGSGPPAAAGAPCDGPGGPEG